MSPEIAAVLAGTRRWTVVESDCRAMLAALPDCCLDSCVTDPPYELTANKPGGSGVASLNPNSPAGRSRIGTGGFMGKAWDATGIAFDPNLWREVLRVLKPGAHLLAFGGTRTAHRMICAIEDAGFEIRDCIDWVYGSGFPKSLSLDEIRPGWGTALKPAHEPIVVARKPLIDTVATNVLEYGTGGINVEGCRVGASKEWPVSKAYTKGCAAGGDYSGIYQPQDPEKAQAGRWPANFVLTHSADCGDVCTPGCPVALLDSQSGERTSGANPTRRGTDKFRGIYHDFAGQEECTPARGADSGTASRFFPTFAFEPADFAPFYYCAKAAVAEREKGCDALLKRKSAECVGREPDSAGMQSPRAGSGRTSEGRANIHPTVKPVALMQWLVRLVTPPGGIVLDPFVGSGTTGIAAFRGGFRLIGSDMVTEHVAIARARIEPKGDML